MSGFSAAACKIQASKCYIESLPLVPKDKRSCFPQGERSAVQLPLDRARLHIWKPSIWLAHARDAYTYQPHAYTKSPLQSLLWGSLRLAPIKVM